MNTIENLKKYNQTRILKLLENASAQNAKTLLTDLKKLNFDEFFETYNESQKEIKIDESKIKELPYLVKKELNPQMNKLFFDLGMEVLSSGEYAVVTMAGGQGTRLGHSGPKGTYSLDIGGSQKFLFEVLKENLEETNKKAV